MKIAFIIRTFPALSETFVLNQITGLLDRGHTVDIYAIRKGDTSKMHPEINDYKLLERTYYLSDYKTPRNKLVRIIKAIGISLMGFSKNPKITKRALNFFRYGKEALSLKLIYKISPFLGKGPYDIIHCHYGLNGNIGASMKQLGFKGKLVTMFHGFDIRLGIKKGGTIYHQLFKTGDCFMAISDYNFENLIRLGANPQKIIFHPVGIDVNKFTFQRQPIPIKSLNTIIILTVARLVQEKGLQYGIRAISELLKEHPKLHVEYRIVGCGQLEKKLRKQVEELDLVGIVSFLGELEQEKVIREMQKANIFLLPSVDEALPTVLMEAQAIGLPIVSTNVGSVSEAMIDKKSGFLVPERDVDSLTEKLEYLIAHPELWLEMGRAGRKHVEEHYDIDKLNDRLERIYKELIGEK